MRRQSTEPPVTQSIALDARYVAKTNDGEYIYIQAKGLYRPGPGTEYSKADPKADLPRNVTQDDVEFFTQMNLEAGSGKYNWLNGLTAFGVLICEGERIIIDAYYLTNFPDREPDDVRAIR